MPRFCIIIEYDGTNYFGWQRQPGAPTIQEAIEDALAHIVRQPVVLHGSGRTDSGVHATGQCAHFDADTNLAPEVLEKALNSLLPQDIVIRSCLSAASDFHARKSAKSKLYSYSILNHRQRSPVGRFYCWHIVKPLDITAMEKAAAHFTGTHDFGAFEAKGSPRSSSVRTVTQAKWETDGQHLTFFIEANGFLRHMVRNIVGTLVEVGRNRLAPDDIQRILESKDRGQAGPTAPAKGLFLRQVHY
ncbi:MAG: tRNA pseudouridine(38-40) synthase TruA [Desulfatibacillaceae bacterium]|nr:tRNA pseudouridine(38-40) synthase TruA [Desulfatibacillaceae bacterium]